ncbi:MAG: ribosomal protein S18-alanine N-acetyltransferase [bacterium]
MIEPDAEANVREKLAIVPMALEHLDEVYAIEVASFPRPWSRECLMSEIVRNRCAHYIVAETDGKVLGYGGMWIVCDEAHITNLAVSPGYRRRKIGERLLVNMLERAAGSGAVYAFLEVRRSNVPARRLYSRYLFQPDYVRKRYYRDNGEDAVVLRLNDMRSTRFRERFTENLARLHESLCVPPPGAPGGKILQEVVSNVRSAHQRSGI